MFLAAYMASSSGNRGVVDGEMILAVLVGAVRTLRSTRFGAGAAIEERGAAIPVLRVEKDLHSCDNALLARHLHEHRIDLSKLSIKNISQEHIQK